MTEAEQSAYDDAMSMSMMTASPGSGKDFRKEQLITVANAYRGMSLFMMYQGFFGFGYFFAMDYASALGITKSEPMSINATSFGNYTVELPVQPADYQIVYVGTDDRQKGIIKIKSGVTVSR